MKKILMVCAAIVAMAFGVSAQSVDTTKVVPHLSPIRIEPVADTALQGMTIIYHCNSDLPPDTITTDYPGIEYIYLYHGDVVDGPDPKYMQEMSIEGVEVKVKY